MRRSAAPRARPRPAKSAWIASAMSRLKPSDTMAFIASLRTGPAESSSARR